MRWGESSVHVDVDASRPALLVLSQAWFPGWSATVDGHDVPVVRVDGMVQGVPVPAGAHEVVLRYQSASLRQALWLAALGALGFAALLIVRQRRARLS